RAPGATATASSILYHHHFAAERPSSRKSLSVSGLMAVTGRQSHVAHRQHHENDRLNNRDNRAESIKSQRHTQIGKSGEDAQYGMVGEHIRVKTNAERKRPEKSIRQVDRNHQKEQPPNRSDQVIAQKPNEPLSPDALSNEVEKNHRAQRESQIGIPGRRLHSRNQSEEVGEQNENEKAPEKGDPVPPMMRTGDIADKAVEPFHQRLRYRPYA